MEFEIEFDLKREELVRDVQIDILVRVAERMVELREEPSRLATLALLTAAAIMAIRNAPPGVGVALDLKDLMVDAMQKARMITKPPPRPGV